MAEKRKKKDHQDLFIIQSYGSELLQVFQAAITKSEAALYLHQSKTRTPLFMMESLLRLLKNISHDDALKKSLKAVKKLEDSLGKIDDYEQFHHQVLKEKNVSKKQVAYFEEKMEKALQKMNARLLKHEYYQDVFNTLATDVKTNFNDEQLVARIREEIKWELKSALHFFMQYPSGFKDMEDEVHELRRKLRWISIYGQSLQGLLVLKEDQKTYTWEKKMVSTDVKKEAYNKLPVRKNLESYIQVNKKAFTALNYVIEQLGKIKDNYFLVKALRESIEVVESKGKKKTSVKAYKELSPEYTEKDLLKEAHKLLHRFFMEYKIHELLIE